MRKLVFLSSLSSQPRSKGQFYPGMSISVSLSCKTNLTQLIDVKRLEAFTPQQYTFPLEHASGNVYFFVGFSVCSVI